MATYNIDILGISEMRCNDSGEKMSAYGNTILHSGNEYRGDSGVGFIISRQMRNSVVAQSFRIKKSTNTLGLHPIGRRKTRLITFACVVNGEGLGT